MVIDKARIVPYIDSFIKKAEVYLYINVNHGLNTYFLILFKSRYKFYL